jgi:hypothetical protein
LGATTEVSKGYRFAMNMRYFAQRFARALALDAQFDHLGDTIVRL